MKVFKWLGILAISYIALVFFFEAFMLGYLQPKAIPDYLKDTVELVEISTTDASGEVSPRKLAGFEMDGKLYVSAHHWPRGWYHAAVANPQVTVRRESEDHAADYVAVTVQGEEFERVAEGFPLSFPVRFVMGFPPERDILRLDPVVPGT